MAGRRKTENEATARLSCRIPAVQEAEIKKIMASGILGTGKTEVVCFLLQRAIDHLAETEYFQKRRGMDKALEE